MSEHRDKRDEWVAFLQARIAEDEQVARTASPGPWLAGTSADHLVSEVVYGQSVSWSGRIAQVCNVDYGQNKRPDVAHIARHDPARVLAEVEAKRRILAMHAPTQADWPLLRVIALPYADHPDYLQKWAV